MTGLKALVLLFIHVLTNLATAILKTNVNWVLLISGMVFVSRKGAKTQRIKILLYTKVLSSSRIYATP
ncbi:hypothetical protein H6G74_09630 [Nostoc spongiaeforme FACHB-130]|uniref:Secreted protein n=1 Tax=Nostoc spongiaeforme FACHB-130 TaxID=1357510 RepID=A0ABR8FWT4_9NOSO|nr:hypothetical protein [Nostoc spongiaeforme]MBD2594584.1 hypothetical protein [Nostoc spongiaeforme FACHB-130]